jgi:hypothetical protein
MVGRGGVTLQPSASLSPKAVGLFEPDACATDIFFWTFSVGAH